MLRHTNLNQYRDRKDERYVNLFNAAKLTLTEAGYPQIGELECMQVIALMHGCGVEYKKRAYEFVPRFYQPKKYDYGELALQRNKTILHKIMKEKCIRPQHRFGYFLLYNGIRFWSECDVGGGRADFFIFTPKCDIIIEYDEKTHKHYKRSDDERDAKIREFYVSCGKDVKIIRVHEGREQRFNRHLELLRRISRKLPRKHWTTPKPLGYERFSLLETGNKEIGILALWDKSKRIANLSARDFEQLKSLINSINL